jgi:hypothetical protein
MAETRNQKDQDAVAASRPPPIPTPLYLSQSRPFVSLSLSLSLSLSEEGGASRPPSLYGMTKRLRFFIGFSWTHEPRFLSRPAAYSYTYFSHATQWPRRSPASHRLFRLDVVPDARRRRSPGHRSLDAAFARPTKGPTSLTNS